MPKWFFIWNNRLNALHLHVLHFSVTLSQCHSIVLEFQSMFRFHLTSFLPSLVGYDSFHFGYLSSQCMILKLLRICFNWGNTTKIVSLNWNVTKQKAEECLKPNQLNAHVYINCLCLWSPLAYSLLARSQSYDRSAHSIIILQSIE